MTAAPRPHAAGPGSGVQSHDDLTKRPATPAGTAHWRTASAAGEAGIGTPTVFTRSATAPLHHATAPGTAVRHGEEPAGHRGTPTVRRTGPAGTPVGNAREETASTAVEAARGTTTATSIAGTPTAVRHQATDARSSSLTAQARPSTPGRTHTIGEGIGFLSGSARLRPRTGGATIGTPPRLTKTATAPRLATNGVGFLVKHLARPPEEAHARSFGRPNPAAPGYSSPPLRLGSRLRPILVPILFWKALERLLCIQPATADDCSTSRGSSGTGGGAGGAAGEPPNAGTGSSSRSSRGGAGGRRPPTPAPVGQDRPQGAAAPVSAGRQQRLLRTREEALASAGRQRLLRARE
jgi:hypothetical protein